MSRNTEQVYESFSNGTAGDPEQIQAGSFRFFSNESPQFFQNHPNLHPEGLVFEVRAGMGANLFNLGERGGGEDPSAHVPPIQFLAPRQMLFVKNDADTAEFHPEAVRASSATYAEPSVYEGWVPLN